MMFIHFDSNKGSVCDDCGNPGSIMHMLVNRSACSVSLCATCFRALALAVTYGSEKLRFFKG
jgi:ribosomal protein S14